MYVAAAVAFYSIYYASEKCLMMCHDGACMQALDLQLLCTSQRAIASVVRDLLSAVCSSLALLCPFQMAVQHGTYAWYHLVSILKL